MSKYNVVCKENDSEFYDISGNVVFDDPSSAGLYLRWILLRRDLLDKYLCDDKIDKTVFDLDYIYDIINNLLRRHRKNIIKEFDSYKLILMKYVCYFYFGNKKYIYKVNRIGE